MEKSLISILMPVYNREEYIGQAIQSVINQTYQNWELIIIDDNSSDETVNKIQIFSDSRIKLISKTINEGVSKALNDGITEAKGEFIGRLDSDDIALNQRLEKQINFLENNPDIDICGSWIKVLHSDKLLKYSELHSQILSELILYSPIGSPTVLLRKCVFQKYLFKEKLRYGEDYEFWSRALFDFKSYNIQEVLVYYRRHENQLTNSIASINRLNARIQLPLVKKLNYDQAKFPDKMIIRFMTTQAGLSKEEIENYFEWCEEMRKKNNILGIFPKEEFSSVINKLRSRVIEEIYFRSNSKINRYMRGFLLLKLTSLERKAVISRKLNI